MSKDIMFWMSNIGRLSRNGKEFEVLENLTDKTINLFFVTNNEVRAWKLSKSLVLLADGKDILTKTKNYWDKLMNSSIFEMDEPLVCPYYSMDTWRLVQLTKKLKGERYPFHLSVS